ncbi:hypothetical protein [Oceanobacillus damuensis]|uniref:hypothetical protein n=1 Tax=Oceanobacillus damuensis TaxID=937928 RepID=UPI00082FCC36|nr:hypothetical protein [Oceanobacillus damuensis]
MRSILSVIAMVSAVSLLYKWRYRLLNTLLTVGIIRRVAVSASMNIPSFREKLLPELFNSNSHNN